MYLSMIGVDYKTAPIALREKISLTGSGVTRAIRLLKENPLLNGGGLIKGDGLNRGVIVLSTCNRTELYFSSESFLSDGELLRLFSETVAAKKAGLDSAFYIKRDEVLITYLFELACGLHSMILGEDQIITQMGGALELAILERSGDSVLNTLFRHAVTCAKRAKSEVYLRAVSPSVVSGAVAVCGEYIRGHSGCRVLVIGNGEMGRLAAKEFIAKGCEVFMTLRAYKNGENVIPKGAKTVPYEHRAEVIGEADIVLSATKSPHHTITIKMLAGLDKLPEYIFDLALPRDIEPGIRELFKLKLLDVDDIGRSASKAESSHGLLKVREIIRRQRGKFLDWESYSESSRKEAVSAR